jgi:hypothetical protein
MFAIEIQLIADIESVPSVDLDESASWGAIRLWVNGINLMSRVEADEVVSALHWYVLPTCEWIVENWDAILHEERLPMPDVVDGVSGIERMAQQRLIGDDEEDALDGAVRAWWHRHDLAVGALGSVLPPTFIRRWGDQIEISMSARRRAGVPAHVSFSGGVAERVPVGAVSSALLEVLEAVSHELVRREPGSSRFGALRAHVEALDDPAQSAARLELLGAPAAIVARLASKLDASGASIEAAPPIAFLFGTLAPDVEQQDVAALTTFVGELPDQASNIGVRTAADECHLLVDRERAVSLAIASGPWAPHDLEQRANAFAAAFLMPSELVGERGRGSTSRTPYHLAGLVATNWSFRSRAPSTGCATSASSPTARPNSSSPATNRCEFACVRSRGREPIAAAVAGQRRPPLRCQGDPRAATARHRDRQSRVHRTTGRVAHDTRSEVAAVRRRGAPTARRRRGRPGRR